MQKGRDTLRLSGWGEGVKQLVQVVTMVGQGVRMVFSVVAEEESFSPSYFHFFLSFFSSPEQVAGRDQYRRGRRPMYIHVSTQKFFNISCSGTP